MSVRDFMTKSLVVVRPSMKIFDAVDLMKKNDIHRLPVVEGDRLVGLITEGTIQEAMPSKATSLSVYEMNYLLNKTTVGDVMIKDVLTINENALLEDGIAKMRGNNVAVLPVLDNSENLVGIITNNDIFDAFLKVTGYNDGGTRVQVLISQDSLGILADITRLLADNQYSIITVIVNRKELETLIEIQVQSADSEAVKKVLTTAGYQVTEATLTNPSGR